MMRKILSFFAYLLLAYAPSCGCIEQNKYAVCYFTDWSHYRPGAGSYDIKKLDVCKAPCSHFVYSFAKYDHVGNGLLIEDMYQGLVPILTGCAKEGKVILLAFGGWPYSTAKLLDPLFQSERVIDEFIVNAHSFIKHNHFHGIDMDVEYPGWYQMTNKTTGYDGKKMFSYLVKGLKRKFKKDKFLVTVAVTPNPEIIDECYEVDVLNEYADWLGIMAYDYYSYDDKKTGMCAPLTNQHGETRKWNVQDSVDIWLQKGMSPNKTVVGMPLYGRSFKLGDEKLHGIDSVNIWLQKGMSPNKTVVGMPLYGRSFKLDDEKLHGIGDPASRPPDAGIYTGEVGVLSYQEICLHKKQDGWTEVYKQYLGAYAYNKNDWVGYDNIQSLLEKVKFILEKQLLGGMFWELGFDDFNNQCGCGNYSMLTAFQKTLNNLAVSPEDFCK